MSPDSRPVSQQYDRPNLGTHVRGDPGGATTAAGTTRAVEFLLQAGAAQTLPDHDGFTALDLAANAEILELLRSPRRGVRRQA